MKKKITSAVLLFVMLFTTIAFASCNVVLPEDTDDGPIVRMTVDINPSLEFMVDDQNNVISVTALNDDGSILIAGEDFVGMTAEEAVEAAVALASDMGYLVKGEGGAEENAVKLSVSGDTEFSKSLMEGITAKAEEVLSGLDIRAEIEKAAALGIEELRQLVCSTAFLSEEAVAEMDEDELYKIIANERVETASLLTTEMRNAYYAAKEYRISFAESEQVAAIIETMGGLYTITHTAYKTVVDLYSTAITELDNFRYNMLVSPDSEYQKSLEFLRKVKSEFLKWKNYAAMLEIDSAEYAAAMVNLQSAEDAYTNAVDAYEAIGAQINSSIENFIATLRQTEERLNELETTLFDKNIEEKLKEQAYEIDESLNYVKDYFFSEFESAHADDLEELEFTLIAEKEQLISKISSIE